MKKLGIAIVSIVLGLAFCQNAPQQAPQEVAQSDKNVVVETIQLLSLFFAVTFHRVMIQ